jgi:hypothetical protein
VYDRLAEHANARKDATVEEWVVKGQELLDGKDRGWLTWAGARLMPETSKLVEAEAEEVARKGREQVEKDRLEQERRVAAEEEAKRRAEEDEQEVAAELRRVRLFAAWKELLGRLTKKEISMEEFLAESGKLEQAEKSTEVGNSDDKTLGSDGEPEDDQGGEEDVALVVEEKGRAVRVEKRKRADSEGSKQPDLEKVCFAIVSWDFY